MSHTPETTPSPFNIEGIFNAALKSYKKRTKKDLKKHDLFKQLEKCDSPAAILAVFQVDKFRRIRTGDDDRLKKMVLPIVNVLYAFSATLGEGVGLIFSPAKVVFAGVGVLLLAAKDVAASQDIVADIFGRIESFFGRLEVYTEIPLTPAMTDKMVQITVEILGILATEEVVMANAQLLKIAHTIDNKVTGVNDGVRGIDENVQGMNVNVKAIDEMVQTIADGDGKEAKATATKVISIVQQTADNVDDVKHSESITRDP